MPKTGADHSLEPPAPKLTRLRGKYPRVAFLSDIHCPYHDASALPVVWQILTDFCPDLIYLGGDIHDNYLLSDHDHDPDRQTTLQDELDSMRQVVVGPVDDLAPNVIFQLGNHEERTYRLIRREKALNKLRSLSFKRAAELPDSWTVLQDQTHLRIGKLLFHHGNLKGRGGGARHIAAGMLDKLRTSSISGHDHRFDVAYASDYEGHVNAAFKNGHLSDVSQARYIAAPNWQTGFSLVEFDSQMKFYHVEQILIHKGKAVYGGQLWPI